MCRSGGQIIWKRKFLKLIDKFFFIDSKQQTDTLERQINGGKPYDKVFKVKIQVFVKFNT
jgi:hypothetical protein